ncbi:MAG: hypothetical protein ACFB2X_03435 [Rivularia sp. (in: cyanobacteria)]
MKFNHKIKINIQEFITSGKFDYIEIGQAKDWILNNFPWMILVEVNLLIMRIFGATVILNFIL